jgi:hypothetical protein
MPICDIYISDVMDTSYINQESQNDDNGGYISPTFSSHRNTTLDIQSG